MDAATPSPAVPTPISGISGAARPDAATAAAASPPEPRAWSEFALATRAQLAQDPVGHFMIPGAPEPHPGDAPRTGQSWIAPLPDLGLLGVQGIDAVSFLHGQLTQDVASLAPGTARWAGYCTAKGRLIATFRLWRDAGTIWLSTSSALAEPIRRKLSMFVLRAKARVSNESEAFLSFGLVGSGMAERVAGLLGISVPAADASASQNGAHLVGLPPSHFEDGLQPRWLAIVPAHTAPQLWQAALEVGGAADTRRWRLGEVRAAVARIVPATTEHFVPQMVNLESVDGVNFRKGCYPGQEVVARSQYLGKLKRRMYLGSLAGTVPAPGSDVHQAGANEPCGEVVLAAEAGADEAEVLFECTSAAWETGALTIGGRALRPLELPYALKAIE